MPVVSCFFFERMTSLTPVYGTINHAYASVQVISPEDQVYFHTSLCLGQLHPIEVDRESQWHVGLDKILPVTLQVPEPVVK